MADEGWTININQKSKNKRKDGKQGANKKPRIFTSAKDMLNDIQLENKSFDTLTDEGKLVATQPLFDTIVHKMIELASSSFFLQSLNMLKASHPGLQSLSSHNINDGAWQQRLTAALQKNISKETSVSMTHLDDSVSSLHVGYSCCLGVGPISRSAPAQYQLAFFLIVSLLATSPVVEVYDPVLTNSDRYVLSRLGASVPENTEGRSGGDDHEDSVSFVYLPHCGAGLSSNVLWTNWRHLHNVVMVGNSFERTLELLHFPTLSQEEKSGLGPLQTLNAHNAYLNSLTHCGDETELAWVSVARVFPWTKETALPAFHIVGTFNDTAVHTFTPPHTLSETTPPQYRVATRVNNGTLEVASPEIIPHELCPS